MTDAQRDATLADNNTATVPPAGVVNSALASGTLIFNTTQSAFQFWDGTVWRQLFVATSSQAGNDGVVRVDSGGTTSTKPTFTISGQGSTYGANQLVTYTTPLNFAASPITSWPETTVPFPGNTSNIYITTGTQSIAGNALSTQRWRENEVEGQVHLWRVITTVTTGSNSAGSIRATLRNPDSLFAVSSVQLIPGGSSAGNNATFYFYTIADSASLGANRGYQLLMQSDITCNVTIESLTRVSLFKD